MPQDSARVMAIVVHPYIMGAPHRLKYFRKVIEHIRALRRRPVLDRRADPGLVSGRAPDVWGRHDAALGPRSNAKIGGLDLVVGPQLVRAGGVDHLALAHHVHVVDELERQRGVLLHEQDGKALLLQLCRSPPIRPG